MPGSYPLIARRADDVVFRTGSRAVTAQAFLSDVRRVAAELDDTGYVINVCRDRYRFTVAFAASVLRGVVSLLPSDGSPPSLRALNARFEGAPLLGDDEPPASAGDLRRIRIRAEGAPTGNAWSGEVPEIPADRLAAQVFTSGSTGQPVGHRKLWGALVERTIAGARQFGFGKDGLTDVVGTVPPQHMYGFETTVLMPLHARVASWCAPSLFPTDIGAALSGCPGRAVLVTTPVHIRALLRADTTVPSPASIISATAPLDAALAREAEERWATEVHEIFGATEVGSIASRRTLGGDVWTLYPGVTLDTGSGDGTALITAPFAGPQALSDVVEVPAPGSFRLIGRQTDMVKVGGRRASLAGLNQILNAVPGVDDGAFMAPDDLEQRPAARLVVFAVSRTLSADAVLSRLRERIDTSFLPRRVLMVDGLPRDSLGKLPRRDLLALKQRLDEAERSAGRFSVPADHPSLPGHFPGNPIVPGVVLLERALDLVAAELGELRLDGLDQVKFLAPVRANEPIEVRCRRMAGGRAAFTCIRDGSLVVKATARLGRSA
ncbi:AMP-binding protein [Marinivivus vitaminiproducens]|uniref:AMP-binding protein n=1 Tax=Marinivivus vitaminiproducens TaxID=3035935 RepID=UPI0027A63687|nr:AMP-binding protein [Geminicoccaceae bacterium SCSIO 64248]